MNLTPEGTVSADAGTEATMLPLAAILEEAERQFGTGQADEARQYLEDVRRRYYESGDASSEGAVLRSLANLEFSLGRSREAERYIELACERYTTAQQGPTAADLSLSLGDLRGKMGESKTAREAYLTAAKLYRTLDDPSGQAHAEFKLGNLHAATNYDMALRHYNFAANLYERAHARMPADDGLRLNNPHLPEHFEDCRQIEVSIMARVARREAERLRHEIGPVVEEPTVDAPPPATVRDLLRGAFVFAIVPAVFIGVVFVVTKLPAFPWSANQTLLIPMALLAGGLSMVLARLNGVESRAVQWGGALAVCASVQIANAALTKNHTIPAPENDGSVRATIAEQLAGMAVASDAPADVAAQRAEIGKVLTTARQRGDRPGEASALRAQAELERRAGSTVQVTVLYGAALEIYRELDDKPKQLEVLVPLGEVHRSLKQFAQAREVFNQAADLYQQRQEPVQQARMLVQVGDLERDLQRPKQARAAYARAIELSHERDPIAEAEALLRLGRLDAALHATETARKAYREALALSEQRHDVPGQAAALLHLGELEVEGAKHEEAAALYGRALALYRTDPQDFPGQVRTLQLWGDLERNRKQYAAAREHYTGALALSEEKDGGQQAAEILIALADVTATMGEREQALDTYMRALGRHEKAGKIEGQIMTLRRLSQLAAKDNLALAQQYAKRAAALQEDSGQRGATTTN